MNLAKAKELLEIDNKDPGDVDLIDFLKAEKLGYEAIDRILFGRRNSWRGWSAKLPSETP